jgi:hypothetical protein
MSITKSEVAWIAIRLLGIYFLIQSLAYFLDLGTAIYALYGSENVTWGVNISDRFDKAVEVSVRLGLFASVYFLLAIYCLLRGSFIYKLIARGPDDGET